MGICPCFKESINVAGSKYYIRNKIGEGGYSTVQLVESVSTHKLFALKKIICHSQEDQETALAEVKYHKILRHRNIVECMDSVTEGTPDMVSNSTATVLLLLPFYQKGTLHDELMRQKLKATSFSELLVLSIFHGICKGVEVIHSVKPEPLAHRDLKTSNILLCTDYTPLIMDLGSVTKARVEIDSPSKARQLQDLASERCSMPYKAPELFHVESYCVIDERTDIWSLGCLLYALCFYKSPFDAVYERGDSVALAVVGGSIHIPESHSYSQDLMDLILTMANVDIEDRPFINQVISRVEEMMSKGAVAEAV